MIESVSIIVCLFGTLFPLSLTFPQSHIPATPYMEHYTVWMLIPLIEK